MQRRIFVAINLPQETKKRLIQKTEKWTDLPVRWTLEDNLHITLAFLGYINDADLPKICEAVNKTTKNIEVFEVCLNRIIISPSVKRPRMLWAVGEKNEELKTLTEAIEKSLGIFVANKKKFHPHVTLGRIRQGKWRKNIPIPEINEKLNLIIPVSEVQILESIFEEGKRKYLLLESCHLI